MTVSRQCKAVIVFSLVALLAGCAGSLPLPGIGKLPKPRPKPVVHPPLGHDLPALPAAGSGRGGYYQDDGPGDAPPPNLHDTPDAQVKAEPLSRYANRPYVVFGKSYTPILDERPVLQRGIGSWYGKKFHGQKTSSGEIYDMYKMTAAHPTLPIPSYARVTHAGTGKSVVVRINDRGPFHAGRIVDLSYTAALKLGLLTAGSNEVTLERLLPDAPERLATLRRNAEPAEPRPALEATADVTSLILASKAEIKAVKAHEGQDGALPTVAEAELAAQEAAGARFYVQLGAFSGASRAADIRTRAARQGVLGGRLEIIAAGALHKVLGGPYLTREQAQEALRSVPSALGVRPIVVER